MPLLWGIITSSKRNATKAKKGEAAWKICTKYHHKWAAATMWRQERPRSQVRPRDERKPERMGHRPRRWGALPTSPNRRLEMSRIVFLPRKRRAKFRCAAMAVAVAVIFVLGGIMAIDALEFEATGQCRDCVRSEERRVGKECGSRWRRCA